LKRILVVEDDAEIAGLVTLHLSDEGWTVQRVATGEAALESFAEGSYDLVVLDLMLPDVDGLEICRRLRTHGDYVPVLMLTAKADEVDRVVGLEVGADDYLTKPFSVRELVARVRALFRRADAFGQSGDSTPERPLEADGIHIDPAKRQVRVGGRSVQLTAREFDLLHHLARHPGRVYSRMQLLDAVWGYTHEGYEHTVNSHINRLRAKIEEDSANPRYILTVWGVGYKFPDRDEWRVER
jgi:DNA-binding response OmpR family regulator